MPLSLRTIRETRWLLRAGLASLPILALPSGSMDAQKPPTRVVVGVQQFTSTPGRAPLSARDVASRLRAPSGFQISVFADGLGSPRMIAVGDDGTVYVTRRDSGDVIALRDDGTGRASAPRKIVTDMPQVHGIVVRDGKIYLATIKELFRGDLSADGSVGPLTRIADDLGDGGQHPNRTLGIGPDGMLYVSVGSTCNQCREPRMENASILRMRTDGQERGVFAQGLRNTVGFGWHPQSKDMWGWDDGSDGKGNDLPPEELNKLQRNSNYGWPFCYGNRQVDSAFSNEPPGSSKGEFCARSVAPVLTYQAHSAPIQMAFYTGTQFPAEFRNDAFVAMRGSWNRQPPTGYKVVRVKFENGQPARAEDFLTGFLTQDGGQYFGRIAGLAVARDGSLLVGDDTNGVIYRVSYGSARGAGGSR